VEVFRGGLALGFCPSSAQREFGVRAEHANIAKDLRVQGSIFDEEISVRIDLLKLCF